jgi:hypothetical protein
MGMGVGDFLRGGLYEMGGYTPSGTDREYVGWGQSYRRTPRGLKKLLTPGAVTAGAAGMFGASIFASALRVGGTVMSPASGFMEEGIWGAAKWGAAEYGSSALIAAAGSSALFSGTQGAAVGWGMVGAFAAGPVGQVAGSAVGAMGMTSILLNPVTMVAAGATLTATMGAYYGAKGSYALLKAGYQHRQSMLRKIDTAGSMAAFQTKNAFTMRQRAMQAMQTNQITARQAFGQEARMTHFNAYRKLQGSASIY